MLNKLTSLYLNALVKENCPDQNFQKTHYWFQDSENNIWLGIPKNEISLPELTLLKTLFDQQKDSSFNRSIGAEKWYDYLFEDGPQPEVKEETVRITQFSYTGEEMNEQELETALKGFFSKKAIIVWVHSLRGIIIETNNDYLLEDEFYSLVSTLEGEFFIKPYFYVGIHRPLTERFRKSFQSEQRLFDQGIGLLSKERVLVFERIFPMLLAEQIPNELSTHLEREFISVLANDPDMLGTIRVFIENNMNITSTAKALYIHRNTLQYRLDKFIEKTGINIKTFSGAFTVYLACLLQELS